MSSQFRRSRFTQTPGLGGIAPFGVTKLQTLSSDLRLLTPLGSGQFVFGYVIQTVNVGAVTDAAGFQAWICAMKVKTTALSGSTTFAAVLAVRDSTVMAKPDLTKLKAPAQALAYSGTLNQTAPGTGYQSVQNQALAYSPGTVLGDDYSNTISAGDNLVLDFVAVITNGPAGFAGTFDAVVWFTSMLAP